MFCYQILQICYYICNMYIINSEYYCGNVKEIADKYGGPYRRLLRELKKFGNTQFRVGGEIFIVKKLKRL